jgi:tetratricopeptide (TPR) repeat protein
VAAASEARSWANSAGGDAPWHLQLREDADAQKAGGWLGRFLKPLILHRKPATQDGRWPVLPAGSAEGPVLLAEPSTMAPLDREQTPAGATRAFAAPDPSPESARTTAPRPSVAQPAPAELPVLRLPRLSRNRLHAEERMEELPSRAFGDRGIPRFGREPWPPGHRAIGAAAPLTSRWWWRLIATAQPGSDPASAATSQDRSATDGGLRHPIVPLEPHGGSWLDPQPLPSRLAVALSSGFPAAAEAAEEASKASNRPPAGEYPRPHARAMVRALTVAGAVAGAFVLGLYVHGGISPTAIELGETLFGLNRLVPERSADGGATPASAYGLPGGSDHPSEGADGIGPARTGGTPALTPKVRDDETRADHGPAIKDAPDQERSSSASADRPAAVKDSATPWDVLYARGHKLQREGDLVAAGEAYRQAIRLNPQQAAVLYDLGYVLQLQGKDDAAMEYYRRAIAQQPRHAFAHYNLGTLLQGKGDARAAIAHYKIAAGIEPGDPYIYYDWARSLEAIGDTASAAALYRKTVALDPNHRPGLDAQQRLATLATSSADLARIQ